ncbi:MAG TPA: hypothetical protein DFS52_22220, partial [Myxococcales bacterium]|nr:hypothetical protein [Myxococcales bacterium]
VVGRLERAKAPGTEPKRVRGAPQAERAPANRVASLPVALPRAGPLGPTPEKVPFEPEPLYLRNRALLI